MRTGVSLPQRARERLRGLRAAGVFGALFAFAVMLLHPLIYDYYFFNINRYKYACLMYASFTGFAVQMLLCLLKNIRENDLRPFAFRITAADAAILFLLFVSTVSCLFSADPAAAFTGEKGRRSGLLFLYAVGAMHFIVSRSRGARGAAVAGLIMAGFLVSLLGILNFFRIDPLGFYGKRLKAADVYRFISTIGNIDFFSAFLCLYLPTCAVLLVRGSGWLCFPLSVCTAAGAAALVAARADGAALALACSVFFVLYEGFSDKKTLFRAMIALSSLLFGVAAMGALIQAYPQRAFPIAGTLLGALCSGAAARICVILAFAVCAVFAAVLRRFSAIRFSKRKARACRRALTAFVCLLALCALVAFIYFSLIDTKTPLSGWKKLLRFCDTWGTHRGGVWTRCLKLYAQSDIRVQLFGFGPDSLKKPLADAYGAEIKAYCGLSFDNAHNEPIQYLLTLGALGLCAYLMLAGTGMYALLKNKKQYPCAAAAFYGLAAYLLHSIVTVNQPITTPLMFLLLSAGISASGRNEKQGTREERGTL